MGGVLLPAFSVRRDGDLGIGDTAGLGEWLELAAEQGIGFLQLLPINETGGDDSPYNAISSVALEPLYLTMEEIPGVRAAELRAAREQASVAGPVDYRRVRAAKEDLLERAWSRWPRASRKAAGEFAAFRERESAWLEDYCVFRSLAGSAGSEVWESWPKSWRTPAGARRAAARLPERVEFHAWVQWLCFRQWRALRRRADELGVQLMGDIPIGVSRNSADVFFGRRDFDLDWCGGAPPERMFKHDRFIRKWGQNWGIPLYRWERMEREGFPWWRQRIDKLTDVFHIFRIDHVLGFYRIYAFPWQPSRNDEFLRLSRAKAAELTGGPLPGWSPRPDNSKRNRAANRDDGDRRLRAVIEAAGGAAVVGEDLGHVPDYVRPHLASLGVAGFRVPHWDHDAEGRVVPGDRLPGCSFATYATHDHEPLAAMWEGFRAGAEAADGAAEWNLRRLADFAGIRKPAKFGKRVQWRLIDALMACRSRYAAVLINDLFGGHERINAPGTVGPHNWSYRLPQAAADYRGGESVARFAESLRRGGRGLDPRVADHDS